MEFAYDFSQYLYCVSICFDEKNMYTKYFVSGIKQGVNRGNYIEERASIFYRVKTRDNQLEWEILFSGAEADERNILYAKRDDHFYVDSVFLGLNEIYKKVEKERKENDRKYEYDVHDITIIQGVRRLLEKIKTWSPLPNSTQPVNTSAYHFAITLPTHWDKKIQTNMIHPIFTEVGLITKTDHPDKLLFFNQLQSDFRYLQSLNDYEIENKNKIISDEKKNDKGKTINQKNYKKITNRQKYHLCSLTFTENRLLVNMDLFSAYYPHLTTAYSHYDAKFLNNISFYIALETKIKRCLELYIKIDNLDIKQVGIEDLNEVSRFISEHRLNNSSYSSEFSKILDTQETLERRISQNDLEPKEIEALFILHADKIRDSFILMKTNLYERIFYPIKKSFRRNMETLYNYKTTLVYAAILILRGMHAIRRDTGPYELIVKWLEDALKKEPDYNAIIFGDSLNAIHRVLITDMLTGTANQIKHHIEKSNALKQPLEIPGNLTEKTCVFPLMPLFTDSKPSFIINIDITFDKVKFACTYTGTDTYVMNSTGYRECNVIPLNQFFVELNKYQRLALSVDIGLKEFMGNTYDQLWKPPHNEKECLIEGLSVADRQNDNSNSSERDSTKKRMQSKGNSSTIFVYHQKEYFNLVLVMYLRYINHSMTKKLTEFFQSDWLDKNVGYVISAEKMLLNNVFGSKKHFKEIFSESIMLQKTDQCRKVRIVTQEEGILPIIQQSLALPFPLRSYSAVVQLHTEYIQITLHQVVKLTDPPGDLKYVNVGDKKVLLKNVSDIIVRDKMIPIQNSNDDTCSNIWNHIKNYGAINYCSLHKDQNYPSSGLYSLGNYKRGFVKLKQHIHEMLTLQTNFDNIDKQQKVGFGHKCNCCFYLSLRDIIDVGFKPTLQKIATIIVASLMNTSLFGNYGVDFVFVIGNLYDSASDSSIHKIYTNILQQAINASIELKQILAQGFVFSESFIQSLHAGTPKQSPYMGDCLTIGKLHQACSETYGIYIGALNAPFAREHNLFGVDYKCNNGNAVLHKKFAMIILQKGQPIPITGCVKKFKMNFVDEDIYGYSYEVLELAVIKLKRSKTIPRGIISLDDISYDKISTLSIGSEQLVTGMYIYLEIQPNNYNSSLQFSLRLNGSDKEYHNDNGCLVLEEPLTVAYF